LKNLESENSWKTKECGYLNDKMKNLESILEKIKTKEISDKYNINKGFNNESNNNNKNSISEYNEMDKTTKSRQNIFPKNNYDMYNDGQSMIKFEDNTGKDECACNCRIF